jgi:hypothetical protein
VPPPSLCYHSKEKIRRALKAITPTVAERMVKKAVNIGDAVNVEITSIR